MKLIDAFRLTIVRGALPGAHMCHLLDIMQVWLRAFLTNPIAKIYEAIFKIKTSNTEISFPLGLLISEEN
jgi:hypothetical protein